MSDDPRQHLIPGTDRAPLSAWAVRYLAAVELAERRVKHPEAPNTRAAYERAWRQWLQHCQLRGMTPIPIDAGELVTYLEMRSMDLAPASVRQHLVALCTYDRAARICAENQTPTSLRSSPVVQRWLTSWGRDNPRAPRKQAAAMASGDVMHLLRIAQEPTSRAHRASHVARFERDRALILLGIGAALRVDELVRLDVDDVRVMERGLRVRVRSSKTDQAGAGEVVDVAPQSRPLVCPVDAWNAWLRVRGDAPGAAFVEIDRQGRYGKRLTKRGAQHIVTTRARRAALEGISSHSMRATMATLASGRGVPIHKIASHGRWRKLDTVRGYIRQGQLFESDATWGLLDE